MRMFVFLVGVVLVASGCSERLTDVSSTSAYQHFVGRQYEVVGDVKAYAIKDYGRSAPVESIDLIPAPGIVGTEVVQIFPLATGTKITVRKVLLSSRWPDNPITLSVKLDGTSIPYQGPVLVDFVGENENKRGDDLNPIFYRFLGRLNSTSPSLPQGSP